VHEYWWKRILHVAYMSWSLRRGLDGTIRCGFTILVVATRTSSPHSDYQVNNVPTASRQPRHLFVLTSSLCATCQVVFFEVARLYVWYNPACSSVTVGTRSHVAWCVDTIRVLIIEPLTRRRRHRSFWNLHLYCILTIFLDAIIFFTSGRYSP
jgi:hypothetical protein